jgi:hypothetical protein
MCSNNCYMLRRLNYKHISTTLTVIFFIIIVYAINSMNQTALIVSIILIVLNIIIETIWILKRREYKTVYWIALSNLVNIFCMISIMVLLFAGKNCILQALSVTKCNAKV